MSQVCQQLHQVFSVLPRLVYPFELEAIPANGIYILFEKGELAHSVDRIVRVGTHTGEGKLRSRLAEHFVRPNKDRSIFRKNIGRAISSRDRDPFLTQWEIDLTSHQARVKYAPAVDRQKLAEVERQVSQYIRASFSFAVLPVSDKASRKLMESQLISTISWCTECGPSATWLGQYSPKDKIRESGLWLVNELYKEPLTLAECDALVRSVIRESDT